MINPEADLKSQAAASKEEMCGAVLVCGAGVGVDESGSQRRFLF